MIDFRIPILIVDDQVRMRAVVRKMLQRLGFPNLHESDGTDALEYIRNYEFGLVLSDVIMSPMNGIELLRAIRGDPRLEGLPVVLISGFVEPAFVHAAKALTVDAYLIKPFDLATLGRTVSSVLARRAMDPGQPRAESATDHPVRQVSDDEPQDDSNGAAASDEAQALKQEVTALLETAGRVIGRTDGSFRAELVAILESCRDRAKALGVEDQYDEQIASIIARLEAAGAPATEGKARSPLALRAAPDRRSKAGGSQPHDRRDSFMGRRRHKRFVEPVLHGTIDGRTYRTGDWAIGGISLLGYAGPLSKDRHTKITLRIEGCEDADAIFEGSAVVVRRDAGALILIFQTLASPTLRILQYLTRHNQAPTEGDAELNSSETDA